MIPAADVGWKVFAEFTADVDPVYSDIHIDLINYMLPDILAEDDLVDTYPSFIQGITGGTPVPKPPHLTGSLARPIRLTGSLNRKIKLTGSVKRKGKVLTGSLTGVRYGKKC